MNSRKFTQRIIFVNTLAKGKEYNISNRKYSLYNFLTYLK
jgi:hypothetical protein